MLVRMLWEVRRLTLKIWGRVTYEWKSATVAFSPAGKGMNSWLAPLMMVRGTRSPDTEVELVLAEKNRGSVCPANTRADLLMIVIS